MEHISVQENIEYLYHEESKLKRTLNTFTILAMFISVLGLFALSLFMVRQKTKSIGIRKVFGASHRDILQLIATEFFVLVLIANIIAWPAAWYISDLWLQEYAYRIGFNIQAYIISLVISIFLVMLTVGINTTRAANANPVDSLKYE